MGIKLLKNKLCINQIIAQKTERFSAEGDEIVPDVKPDILSVVSTNGSICIYKKEILEGSSSANTRKVKIDGCVNIYVTYIADDEKSSLRALNTTIDFSRTIEMKDIKTETQIECKTDLESIDCRILNGRKISLKANMQLTLMACDCQNIDYISDIEDKKNLELLRKQMSINTLVGSGTTKVYAKDTVQIESTDNLSEIMKAEINLVNKENKISYNKVLTKADAVFKIMYLTDDERINTCTSTVPIMGFIDIADIADDNICDVSYTLRSILVKPSNVEEHSVQVEAEIEILCFVYKKQEISMIQDLYSRTMELKYSQKDINIMKEKNYIDETFNFRKTEQVQEIGRGKILDVEVKPNIISTSTDKGRISYKGEINLKLIYIEEFQRLNVKDIVEPFEFSVSNSEIEIKDKMQTNIEITKKDFVLMPDGNIDIKIDMSFKLNIVKEATINVIDDIEETRAKDSSAFSIVIYYTKPGDTLWNIAKRFGSTVAEIVKINEIENPDVIMPGEQLFIPR